LKFFHEPCLEKLKQAGLALHVFEIASAVVTFFSLGAAWHCAGQSESLGGVEKDKNAV